MAGNQTCCLIQLDGYEILINCPISLTGTKIVLPFGLKPYIFGFTSDTPSPELCFDSIDAILITNAYGLTGLPFFIRNKYCAEVPIYATEHAFETGRLLIEEYCADSVYHFKRSNDLKSNEVDLADLYTIQEFENLSEKIHLVNFGQLCSLSEVLRISPKRSGSSVEGASWMINYYDYTIAVLENTCILDNRPILSADINDIQLANMVIFLQQQEGVTKEIYDRKLQAISKRITSCVEEKRSAMIVIQQMNLFLDILIGIKSSFGRYPVYLFGKTCQTLIYMAPRFPDTCRDLTNDLKSLIFCSESSQEDMIRFKNDINQRPCIIMYLKATSLNNDLLWNSSIQECRFPPSLILTNDMKIIPQNMFAQEMMSLSSNISVANGLKNLITKHSKIIFLAESLVSDSPSSLSALKYAEAEQNSDREILIIPNNFEHKKLVSAKAKLPDLNLKSFCSVKEITEEVFIEYLNGVKLPIQCGLKVPPVGQIELKLENNFVSRVVSQDEAFEFISEILQRKQISYSVKLRKDTSSLVLECKPPFHEVAIKIMKGSPILIESRNIAIAIKLQSLLTT